MYIGLISDTHGVFADDVRAFLEPVDQIWHAGDFGTLQCARDIAAFKGTSPEPWKPHAPGFIKRTPFLLSLNT